MSEKYYHVTLKKNISSILKNGLVPQIGELAEDFGENEPAIYLFASQEDMSQALYTWLGEWYNDNYGEDCELAVLHIDLPSHLPVFETEAEYECVCKSIIPPEYIEFYDLLGNVLTVDNFQMVEEEGYMAKYDLSTADKVQKAVALAQEKASNEPNQDGYNAAWLHGYAYALKEVAEQQKRAQGKKVFLLKCLHESRFGADAFASIHYSREDAEKHVETVKLDSGYLDEEGRDDNHFTYDIEEIALDIKSLERTGESGKIKIDLGFATLVAEQGSDPNYNEVFIGLENEEGCWSQDLAIVRQKYHYDEGIKAVNIEWDVDCDEDRDALPTEIAIPKGMTDEDEISDYLSDVTGYCHKGFVLIDNNVVPEKAAQVLVFGDKDNEDYTHEFSIDIYEEQNEISEPVVSVSPNPLSFHVFRCENNDISSYNNALLYWSNACGDLHHHGQYDITKDELPDELKRAYDEVWSENYGSYCYLVETSKGYGIALINEYDNYTAEKAGCSHKDLFELMLQDADNISKHPAFKNAEIFCGENGGFEGCHELAVVFPASVILDEFDEAGRVLEDLAYASVRELSKPSLEGQVQHAEKQKGNDVSSGRTEKNEIER